MKFTIHNDRSMYPSVVVDSKDVDLASDIVADRVNDKHTYSGANAIDLLDRADALVEHEPELFMDSRFAPFAYELTHSQALPPHKHRSSDSGFDLTLIEIKRVVGKVVVYGTGVRVTPPLGFYFDLVPRSSMIKCGYMLANSVGIIDQGYTGEIMVPLIKIDPDAPELSLPATVIQLIPRKWYGFTPIEHIRKPARSLRGDGGFGSTSHQTGSASESESSA